MDTPEFGTTGYQGGALADAIHSRNDALQHDPSLTEEDSQDSDDHGEDSFISHPEDEPSAGAHGSRTYQPATTTGADMRRSDPRDRPGSGFQQQQPGVSSERYAAGFGLQRGVSASGERPGSSYGQQRPASGAGDRPGSAYGQQRPASGAGDRPGDRPGSAYGQQRAVGGSSERPGSAYRSAGAAASQQAQAQRPAQSQVLRSSTSGGESGAMQHASGNAMAGFETGRSDHEDEVEGDAQPQRTGYRASDYADLPVSKDLRDLFQYITRYKPQNLQLDAPLKPFIPDYIPAVGDIDEFIKVPRPDGRPDYLGLKVLDEPAARQTDPSVLALQLRQTSKRAAKVSGDDEVVSKVENASKNSKRLDEWIQNIGTLHKSKPPSSVSYSKNMPDIDALMEQWPDEVETLLQTVQLPDASLDMDLKTFVTLVCSILDIPVYANPVESLHVLFTLFLEFKHNPAFQQPAQAMQPGLLPHSSSMMSRGSGSSSRMGTPAYAANVITF
ncbi:hypothetical protein WJX72_000119 [[Myrmecia] bisecta]|uniref:Intraflagellar transport protein 46 homolog n=1 Tax=[Myrmecia] bisecta TaxID=41462 RepID=A0AAW1PGD3_9CHLO